MRMSRFPAGTVVVLALIAAVGCGKAPSTQPETPTRDRVVASSSSIGVPYDRLVLLRYGDHLLALELSARTQLGDNISYRWHLADDEGAFAPGVTTSGEGETAERPSTGRISLPGPLKLEWSRGSTEMGWLYWPRAAPDLAVYSRPFQRLADIGARPSGGDWLSRDAPD
jgi:hypothetical protein